jgi:hypothetical protein
VSAVGEPKALVWNRFRVVIPTSDPSVLFKRLDEGLPKTGSFAVTAIGPTAYDVRLVVEYTARGSNSHDVRKRIKALGVDPMVIDIRVVAMVDQEFGPNAGLIKLQDEQRTGGPVADELVEPVIEEIETVSPLFSTGVMAETPEDEVDADEADLMYDEIREAVALSY